MKFEIVQLPSPTATTFAKEPQSPSPHHHPRSSITRRYYGALCVCIAFAIVVFCARLSPAEAILRQTQAVLVSTKSKNARTGQDQIVLDLDHQPVNAHRHSHNQIHHVHHLSHDHPNYSPPSASASTIVSSSRLTKDQQLAALTSFILSPLHSNSLPVTHPINMEDLLEFDIRSERADEMLQEMTQEIWESEQVIVFGKLHHPPTRVLNSLLKTWEVPRSSVIHLDKREDGYMLEGALRQLSISEEEQAWSLPLLIVRGIPISGVDRIKAMKEDGSLDALLA